MKISPDLARTLEAAAASPATSTGQGVANDQRWLGDLERAWLQNWQRQSGAPGENPPALAEAAAADAPSPATAAVPAALQEPHAVPSAVLCVPQAAHLLPLAQGQQPYGMAPPDDAAPGTLPAAPAVAASSRGRAQAAEAMHTRPAARVPPARPDATPVEPVAFHVAVTEAGAQVSLRDARLAPQVSWATGQAIARQLGGLGLQASRVYVNGIEVLPVAGEPADGRPPARTPVSRSQEK